jgi:hypothetical protein
LCIKRRSFEGEPQIARNCHFLPLNAGFTGNRIPRFPSPILSKILNAPRADWEFQKQSHPLQKKFPARTEVFSGPDPLSGFDFFTWRSRRYASLARVK